MTAPVGFNPDGRPPIELLRLSRERSGQDTAPTGYAYAGAPGETLTVYFVSDGAAPETVTLGASGTDPMPACHPYADLTGWGTAFVSASLGTAAAGQSVRVVYTVVGAAVSWQPLDGAAGPVLDVGAAGDVEGAAVSVAAAAQRPVRLGVVVV